jgi:Domain of unknown function (DUF1788)
MSRVERLIENFGIELQRPNCWRSGLAAPERVWIAVYDPNDERRVAARLQAFEHAALQGGCSWYKLDLRTTFAAWMTQNEYKEAYFETPDHLKVALGGFKDFLHQSLQKAATHGVAEKSFVVLVGIASLYPFVRISEVMGWLAPLVKGKVLVMFPGEFENGNMRFLGARDGWSYQAVVIRGE